MTRKKKKPSVLLERLAKAEHIQWVTFSKIVASSNEVILPPKMIDKWKQGWGPYDKLPEELKEVHRKWAHRPLHILKVFFRTHFHIQLNHNKYVNVMNKFKQIGLDDHDIEEIYKSLNEGKGVFNAREK